MYSEIHRRYFARELARSGGNVDAAVTALREQYEDLRGVGGSTLRRFMREKGAGEMIAAESAMLMRVAEEVAVRQERDRLRSEQAGSELDRIARDESILDDLRSLVKDALDELVKGKDEQKALPVKQIADLYERMTRVHDARRARVLPALASRSDMTILMRVLAEEIRAELGTGAPEFIKRFRERYKAALATALPPAPVEAQ